MSADDRALTPEERRQLEDAYRQAIGAVRALARVLNKPDPFKARAERQAEQDISGGGRTLPAREHVNA